MLSCLDGTAVGIAYASFEQIAHANVLLSRFQLADQSANVVAKRQVVTSG